MGWCASNEEEEHSFHIPDSSMKNNRKFQKLKKGKGLKKLSGFITLEGEIREYASKIVLKMENQLGKYELPSNTNKSNSPHQSDSTDLTKKGSPNVKLHPMKMLDDNWVYEGEWRGDNKHGFGTHIWADGSMYVGQWKKNKPHGKGRLIHADGEMYEGDWVKDEAHGKGTYIHLDGTKYEGEWVLDKQEGYGVESYPDGSKYSGMFAQGKK